jgi:hypothetical protein
LKGDALATSRQRTLKAGIIAFHDRHVMLPCTDGLEVDCEVVWRRAPEVGVRFLSKPRRVTARRTQVVKNPKPQ